jgi:NADH-quinone oxidoreductase subunit L
MRPTHIVGRFCASIDRLIFDGILHGAAGATVLVSKWDRAFDETVVDGLVNLLGNATWSAGNWLKVLQTGRLRQYVMFIVAGVVALFGVLLATFPR